jgi:hypothetical protein
MNIENRITPHNFLGIILKEKEIYVFGSNLKGRHGKGSAKFAADNYGAQEGLHFGLSGQSFAIPTRDKKIKTLALIQIKYFVDRFIDFAKEHQDLTFFVVEIGCMNAGFEPKDIAPLFKEAMTLENVKLPLRFWEVLSTITNTPLITAVQKPSTDVPEVTPISIQELKERTKTDFTIFSKWKDGKEDQDVSVFSHWKDDKPYDDRSMAFPSLRNDEPKDDDDYGGIIKHFRD